MIPRLADFQGRWRIERQIEDRRNGPPGRFVGMAEFAPAEDTLRYVEEGTLTLGNGPPMKAVRRYRYGAKGDRIVVTYPDGKPFYSFDPAQGIGTHFCVPDVYRVSHDFSGWPSWLMRWDVSGPKKDYTVTSLYLRD